MPLVLRTKADYTFAVTDRVPGKSSALLQTLHRLLQGGARADTARMEAFLSAVPMDYCGFATDGSVAYSASFCATLDRTAITALHDVQDALTPSDAAVLEGAFARLQEAQTPFSLLVTAANGKKHFRLSGRCGQNAEKDETLHVLWLEDVTADHKSRNAERYKVEDIAEERNRLQAALDRLPLPLWMRDSRTDLLWCNRAYAAPLDLTPAGVVADGREWLLKPLQKNPTKSSASGKALAQKARDSGQTETMRAHAVLSGKRRLMAIHEMPLPAFHVTLGYGQDLTREEEIETAHARDTAANKELLEQLGTAIGIYDAEQHLEFYNTAFARLWDLEDRYLNTRPRLGDLMEKLREMRRLPEQADFRKFKQSWLGMFTNLIAPHEDMLYLPNGNALRMLAVPHPMGGLMMTFEDVTSRLELESSYNTLVAVQKETLDNLAESVAVYGGDGRLKLWNPAFSSLWKLHPEDLDGQPHITRLVEKMKNRFPAAGWEVQRTVLLNQALDRNLRDDRMVCADGTMIDYATVPLPDGGILVTQVDVTDAVRVEHALREKNAALEAAERVKTDFLANVSYQLRTPLSTIMGFTEILANEYFGPLNERQKEYTGGMHEAGERLLHLINDILDLS
ncbi:MAG: PAS-domain containing protein, partial [Alphaproteobacteria bacterium]|nr:PAS-domain containing protein [Alphaproteobacteria bacterium]